MNRNDNFYRTQNGGVHSVSSNAKAEHLLVAESRIRSAHFDRIHILHAGVVSASKKTTER